jgi:hypothetical protein
MLLVKRAGAKRHKVAHWIWGYSPETPDALILTDPDAVTEFNVAMRDFLDAEERGEATESKSINHALLFTNPKIH